MGALLDTALDVFVARLGTCLAVAVPLWVPFHLLERGVLSLQGRFLAATVVAVLAGWLVQSVTVGSVAVVVQGHLQGRPVSAGTALRVVLGRAPALLAATALTGMLVAGGLVACLLPGLALMWILAVVPAALMLERLGPLESLGRSARLMANASGLGLWLGVAVVQWCLRLPVALAPAALDHPDARAWVVETLRLPPPAFDALDVALSSLLMGLGTAFGGVWLAVFYVDRRIRREGYDLRLGLERLRDGWRSRGEVRP